MLENTSKKPRYANADNKHIAAVVSGLFKFRSAEVAEKKLADIKRQYTITRQQDEAIKTPHIILWLKDYAVTEEESAAGYLGNYACIRLYEIPHEDLWTLKISKIVRELKQHPLRKRPASRCPNWGHPVLRSVLKEKQYSSLEEAAQALEALHLEYPETTIPADGMCKLYLMIFSRRENPKQPIEKYILEIRNLHGGGFVIESRKNLPKTRMSFTAPAEEVTAEPGGADAEKPGHFASMVALKKKRKKL